MKKVTIENCLATCFPEVAAEWHPTKNGNVVPRNVLSKTHKVYYWFICKKGHEWKSKLGNRCQKTKRGCPYCANYKACDENCLQTCFPEISAEWNYIKNDGITPRDVLPGSAKKYWFVCKKGHEWKASLQRRTHHGYGCPYCANQKVCNDNCLATKFPKIAAEWHPTKNGNKTPNNVIAGSGKKYWFICKKGHEWESGLSSRKSNGCPCCSGRKVCVDNCLSTLFPEIAEEWHPTKNGDITPSDVVAGSHKKYWFQCEKGHEWNSTLNGRTSGKCGCPICLESKGEKVITGIFKKLKIKYKPQFRFKSCKNTISLPFDFVVRTKNGIKIIEYQGIQHFIINDFFGGKKAFNQLQKHDRIKSNWCKKRGVPLLAISYLEFDKIEEIINQFVL